ncbi:MAG: YtxH domain-containing protein [Bacteroidota bacterium]|nr:YtxH domain-containing protein [Ferruginibacter sp.]
MSNPNKILLGLLGAAAVGVVVGMLLAPEKGGEVRQKIADKATDLASKIGDYITSGKEKFAEAGENLANKARSYGEDAMGRAERARSNMS